MKYALCISLILLGLLFSKGAAAQADTVLYPVYKNGHTIYLDGKGQTVHTDTISTVENFSHGFAVVADHRGKRGAIDATGKLVIPFGATELFFYPNKKWWVAQYYPDSLRIYPLGGGPAIYDGPGKFVLFYPEIDRMIVTGYGSALANSILFDMNGKKIAEQHSPGSGTVQFTAIEEQRPGETNFHNRHCLGLVAGTRYALTDINGKILFDSTRSVVFSQGKMVLTGPNKAAIIDTQLRQLVPFSAGYNTLEIIHGTPYYFARKGAMSGVIDTAQRVIFPFTLSGRLWGHDTRLFETINNDRPSSYTLYTYTGKKLVESKQAIQLQPMQPNAFHNDFPVIIKKNDTTYQLWKDDFIGKPYRQISGFSKDGWAIFASQHHTGLLDTAGHEILVTDYHELAYPQEGMLAAGIQIPCPECKNYPCASSISTMKETKVRQFVFLDIHGRRLNDHTYDFIFPFQHGQAHASRDCKDMVINKNGDISNGLIYVSEIASGACIVQNDQKQRALADTNGKVISPWVTDFQMKEGSSLAFIFVNATDHGGPGAIKTTQLPSFTKGRIRFEENGNFGLMDSTGKVVLPAIYSNVGVSTNYIFVQQQHDGSLRSGLLDMQGQILLAPIYQTIRALGNGKFLLQKQKDGDYSIYNIVE